MSETTEQAQPSRLRRVPPFDGSRLRILMMFDTLGNVMLFAAAAAAFLFSGADASPTIAGVQVGHVALVVVIGVMIYLSVANAKAWIRVRELTPRLDTAPAAAEDDLASMIGRPMLNRTVRLTAYHRLAMLRHRQQDFAETARICETVLGMYLGGARRFRPHMLLMLAESLIEIRDLRRCERVIHQLHSCNLSLLETLQRLALTTRFEISAGLTDRAIDSAARKVELAELMPAPQSGAMHAMLAFAAETQGRPDLARWLRERAELLAPAESINDLIASSALPMPGQTAHLPADG